MSRRRKSGKIGSMFSVFIGFITICLLVTYGVFFAIVAAVFLIMWITIKLVDMKKTEKVEEERWKMQKNFAVIDQMDGHEFECFVAKVLAKNGFQNVQVTKASGDYGVDIIAYDNGVKCAFQCKRYTGTLGLQPIQEVSAGARYYGASVAYVITNSHFSANAANLANRIGVKLWDRNSINYLINRINEFERKEKDGTD